jgi:hypothetical protein
MPETHITRPVGWEADAINGAFTETGIKFNVSNTDALAQFKAGEREVTFDEAGQPYARYDREILPLGEALTRWAADSTESICDRRTLPRSPGGGRRGIASKADLPDVKAKSAYIAEFGYKAYSALPTRAVPTEELKYRDQFYRLPIAEKTRLIRKHGEDFIRSLPSRPTSQPYGGYINREALERQKEIRPSSR